MDCRSLLFDATPLSSSFGVYRNILRSRVFNLNSMQTKKVMKQELEFKTITPSILYFGNPVAIVSSINADGSPNLAPISSFWALGWTMVLGLLCDTQTFENFQSNQDCVVNVPSPDQWEAVERLAPLTGKDPVPAEKSAKFSLRGRQISCCGSYTVGE